MADEKTTLPISGITVEFHGLRGRDFIEAERACRDRTSEKEYGLSLLARRCLFDGRQAVVDDVLDLEEEDLNALISAVPSPLGSGSQPKP